jgi:hypothetical protein
MRLSEALRAIMSTNAAEPQCCSPAHFGESDLSKGTVAALRKVLAASR